MITAMDYAARGWSIIPILSGTKRPPSGFNLTRRFHESAEPDELNNWFRSEEFSMAVCLGDVSDGLTCRDFDEEVAYQQWATLHPGLAEALPTVRTPRGRHVYFTSDRSDFGDRQIIPGFDGELKRGGYVLLPESVHPTGTKYQWIRDVDAPHVGDLHAAGLIPPTGSAAPPSDLRAASSFTMSCVTLPHIRGFQSVSHAIEITQPTGFGTRHFCLFQLARLLKATELSEGTQRDLRDAFNRWFRLAKPRIRTKCYRTSWFDFLESWENVRIPYGATVAQIASRIEGTGFERLKALCRELQATAGDSQFHLDCRTAAKTLGVSHMTAARWLRKLCHGPLELVSKGSHRTHRASEYRYRT